jgi:hypothetical protein
MRVEDGLEVAVGLQLGRQHGRHAHEFVGDDRRVSLGRAERLEHRNRRRGQADVLLVFPQVLVQVTPHAELIEEPVFELVEHGGVHVADVDQDDLLAAARAGLLIDEGPSPVDDAHVVQALDLVECGAVARIDQAVDGRVEDLAVLAEPIGDRAIGGEQGTDEDGASNIFQVDGAGEEALQDGSDPADFACRLMGDVHEDVFIGHLSFSQLHFRTGPRRPIAM